MQLHTYLNYNGNCLEAFEFYEQHLGAKILSKMLFKDMPGNPHPEAIQHFVLHARLALGDTYIMASDVPPPAQFQPMRSVYLTLNVDSNEEAERIHAVLADGGQIFMGMEETFYAYRFSMLRDKFGTSWMITHEKPMPA